MHTKVDTKGNKSTIVNATDLKALRTARQMADHIKQNVVGLNGAADSASKALDLIINFYEGPAAESAPAKA